MRDQSTTQPIYAEAVGLSTAEVYHGDGVYSVFLVGDNLACYLGKSTSLETCKEEIKHLQELARSLGMPESEPMPAPAG